MTCQELDQFFETHQNIEWADDSEALLFRNTALAWYQDDQNRATRIEKWKLDTLSSDELLDHINRGLDIEHITRVTGYFAKTHSFNPGKRAELKERHRVSIDPTACND